MVCNARARLGAPAVLLPFLCGVFAPQARAQYEMEGDSSIWLRGVLDVRVARGGSAPSWTDSGPGKTRYGGTLTDAGYERTTRLELSQLAIEVGAALPWNLRAQMQLNLQPDLSDDNRPWLIEALLRREWGPDDSGWATQAGLMNAPFSLEHVGPAWSPEYTISASALGSWLWEEISLAGIEGEWWHVTPSGLRLGALVGAGFGPDQLGRLVAVRGWAMGDGLSGINGDLPLPSRARIDIFDERDDRPAAYTWLSLGDAAQRVSVRAGYFDNFGDDDVQGVWETQFATIGATLQPHPHVDLVVQYLRGQGHTRDTTNDSALRAYYVLLSHHQGRQRVSLRYDWFRVNDLDGGSSTQEKGEAVTFAWFFQMGLRHRIGFEHIWLNSHRPSSVDPEPSQDGWQLSYRFRY
jgi:hypothetical protein